MFDMSQYKQRVHRSLLQRALIFGIPQLGLLILLTLGLFFIYILRWYWFSIFIVLLYFVMRHLTKLHPWYIDITINRLKEKDVFIP